MPTFGAPWSEMPKCGSADSIYPRVTYLMVTCPGIRISEMRINGHASPRCLMTSYDVILTIAVSALLWSSKSPQNRLPSSITFRLPPPHPRTSKRSPDMPLHFPPFICWVSAPQGRVWTYRKNESKKEVWFGAFKSGETNGNRRVQGCRGRRWVFWYLVRECLMPEGGERRDRNFGRYWNDSDGGWGRRWTVVSNTHVGHAHL